MKHKHHIIPKHINGSDDPYNLIELSIEDHAEAHRLLYEQHNRIEDKIAWLCLSGRKMTEEDRIDLARSGFKKFSSDPIKKAKRIENIKIARKKQVITEEHKKNIGISLKLAYKEGRRTYTKPSMDSLVANYNKNKEKITEGRKNSTKWKQSVTSIEYRNKKCLLDPRSKKVSINNIIYNSIREACRKTSYSYFKLRKILESNTNDSIFFC